MRKLVSIELPNDQAQTLRAAVMALLSDECEAVNRLRPGKRRNEHEKRELRLRSIMKAIDAAGIED